MKERVIRRDHGLSPSPAAGRRLRWDLTATPVLGALLRSPLPLTALRLLALALLIAGIAAGLAQPSVERGLTLLLFWGLFWPFLTVLVTPTLGNVFCAICPHGFVGKWLTRIGLRRPFPARWRGGWIGLLLLVFGYWFIHYTMPGSLTRSTAATAWFFLGFTVLACGSFLIFSGMAYCKHLCPLGRLLAVHGKAGATRIATRAQDCATCRDFDCAKACSYRLSPFQFEARNNMDTCTLCMDCVQSCDSVRVELRPPGSALIGPIRRGDATDPWVLLVILAVAAVAIQLLHGLQHSGLQHSGLQASLPWNVAGGWLQQRFGVAAESFNFARLLGLLGAVAATVLAAWVGYARAAAVVGRDRTTVRQTLAYALAPLALLGLVPHAVTRFVTRDGHELLNALAGTVGWRLQLEPFAARSDDWVQQLALLSYLGMAWALALSWHRAGLLTAERGRRWRVWLWGSLPILLYIAVFGFKLWALATYGTAHHHH